MSIQVREANPGDYPWVAQLMGDSSVYSVPVGRDIPNTEVKAAVLGEIHEIVSGVEDLTILVAENEDAERMGLLLLQLDESSRLTGESQGQIYSLAVEPKFWGTPAVARLVQEAARVSARHGHKYLVGQVTAANRRTYLKSLRLGFEVEAYELVMACDLNGPAPMPGRPDSQKAHDVGRRQRRLLAKRRAKKKLREQRRQK